MANPENKASMQVLEKIGMNCLGLNDLRGHQDMFYKLDKELMPRRYMKLATKEARHRDSRFVRERP